MKKLLFASLIFSNSIFATITTTVNPDSGTGLTKTFVWNTTISTGLGDLAWMAVTIGDSWVTPGTCSLIAYPTNQAIYLMTDTGSWGSAMTNSQCNVLTVTRSFANGNLMQLTATIMFSNTFGGTKNNFNVGSTLAGAYGGGMVGSWTIPPPGPPEMSLTATEINTHEMLLDDATGQYIERPTSISPWIVRLKNGKNVHIAAADNVRVKSVSHSWEPVGDSFIYHFKIDTSDAPYIMRLGITEDQYVPIGESSEQTQPKGWHGLVQAWANLGEAELSDSSEFSLKSKWRPGLQAFFIMSDKAKEPIPSFPETENNIRIATAASIFNNSVRKFVIGPAIAPDLSEDGLHELVQRWVEDYGFGFLGPWLSGIPLSELKAGDAFEQEILDCLIKFGRETK